MDNQLYDRQHQMNLETPDSITVIGCGGIGSWVAILAAMSGVPTLYLFDPDVMEESNRNRLPFCQSSINVPKVEVVANYIRAIRPDAIVVAVPEKLEGTLLDIQLCVTSVMIECTDSPRTQFSIYKACQKARVRFIRAGYDGLSVTVTSSVTGWMRTDVEEENYAFNPSWVVPAVTVAALAVGKLMKFPTQEIALNIGEIGIPVLQRQQRLTARCNQTGRGTGTRPAGLTPRRRRRA